MLLMLAFKPLEGFLMYNSVCSGTFASVIIRSIFGWRGQDVPLWQDSVERGGFIGTLSGLRVDDGGGSATIVSNASGVHLVTEGAGLAVVAASCC